jgi:hypothetical protein
MNHAMAARIVCASAVLWFAWVLTHAFVFDPAWHLHLVDAPIRGLPYWGEAWGRVGRACAGAALTGLASWQLGRRLEGRLLPSTTPDVDRLLFALALGVLAISEILLLLALTGMYRPAIAIAVLLLCAASRPIGLIADLRRLSGEARRVWTGVKTPHVFWLTPAVLACGFAAVAVLAPETEYDALWYHLWLPVRWFAAGRLVDIVQEYPSLYPGAWELLYGAASAAGGPVAARLLHFACAPLAAASACLIARAASPTAPRLIVAAIVLTAPTVMWEASTAYVDLALMWFVTLAVAAAFRYHATDDRRWIVVGGLMTGAAMSIKHLGLISLMVLAGALLVREMWQRGGRQSIAAPLLLAVVAFSIPAPWYLRAFVDAGNPVFPEMYSVFGARPETRWSDGVEASLGRFKARFGMGRTPAALAALPWDITTHGARFGGAIGPLFLLLIPFAVVARDRRRLGVLAAGCLSYGAVWASPLGSLQLRFLLPIVPCLAVLAAAGANVIFASARRAFGAAASAVAQATVVLLLLANLPLFTDWYDTERRVNGPWLTHVLRGLPAAVVLGSESADAYLSRLVPTYRAWQAIDERTDRTARILTFVGGDHLYSHRERLWSDATMATPITWGAFAGDEPRMLAAARRAGITHVLFDKQQFTSPDMRALAIVSADTRTHYFAPFYEDDRIEVVRVVYPQSAESVSAAADR